MKTKTITTLTSILFIAIMAFNIAPASAARVQLVWDDGTAEDFLFAGFILQAAVYFSPHLTHPASKTGDYLVVMLSFYIWANPVDFIVHIYGRDPVTGYPDGIDMVLPFTVLVPPKFTAPGWLNIRLDKTYSQFRVTSDFFVSVEYVNPALELGLDLPVPTFHTYYLDPDPAIGWFGPDMDNLMIRATVRYPGPP